MFGQTGGPASFSSGYQGSRCVPVRVCVRSYCVWGPLRTGPPKVGMRAEAMLCTGVVRLNVKAAPVDGRGIYVVVCVRGCHLPAITDICFRFAVTQQQQAHGRKQRHRFLLQNILFCGCAQCRNARPRLFWQQRRHQRFSCPFS